MSTCFQVEAPSNARHTPSNRNALESSSAQVLVAAGRARPQAQREPGDAVELTPAVCDRSDYLRALLGGVEGVVGGVYSILGNRWSAIYVTGAKRALNFRVST